MDEISKQNTLEDDVCLYSEVNTNKYLQNRNVGVPSSDYKINTDKIPDSIPPKITSLPNKTVIKPVAFKPLSRGFMENEQHRYSSTPTLTRSKPTSFMPHYGSSSDLLRQSSFLPAERKLRSASPIAMTSLPYSSNRKLRIGYESMDNIRKTPPVFSFKDSNSLSKSSFRSTDRVAASEGSGSLLDLTPSPCESSAFTDMEVVLRERDYELSYLRQTMEHNEQVIFKVYQEKEHAYERELRKLKAIHETRLRAAAQKSLRLEQMMMMQTYQLQEEKKRLREENTEANSEISALREEIDSLRLRLEETEWSLCQKSGELAHIKSKLKDIQGDETNKGREVVTLNKQIRQMQSNLELKDKEIKMLKDEMKGTESESHDLSSILKDLQMEIRNNVADIEDVLFQECTTSDNNDVDKLKNLVKCLIDKLILERGEWEKERCTWANEKEKVLRYQKQLQLSYIEMFRRNRTLEMELENVTNYQTKSNCKKEICISHTAVQL